MLGLVGAFVYPLIALMLVVWLTVFYVVQKPAAIFQDEIIRQEYFALSKLEKWKLRRKRFLAYLLVPVVVGLLILGILQGYGWSMQKSGYASWKSGDQRGAVQTWEQVVAVPTASEQWVAYYNLGTVALINKDFHKSTKLLNQAWDNMPFLPGAYTNPEAFTSVCQVVRNQTLANPKLQIIFANTKQLTPHLNFTEAEYANLKQYCSKEAFAHVTAFLKENNPEKLKSKGYFEAKKVAKENQGILDFLSKSQKNNSIYLR